MKKFKQIVLVDRSDYSEIALSEFRSRSRKSVKVFSSVAKTKKELIERIKSADAIILTWATKIDKDILKACPQIVYIGIAGKTANLDMREVNKRNIKVSYIPDGGNEATAEFIFWNLLNIYRNTPSKSILPKELYGKQIGVIGLGGVGKRIADIGIGFGMKVLYFSKTRNTEYESKDISFVPLTTLIKSSDVICLAVPKDSLVLLGNHLNLIKPGAIIFNTCLGKPFTKIAFEKWISKEKNIAVFDSVADKSYYDKKNTNIICSKSVAGRTIESQQKISAILVKNLNYYLEGKPINIINK